MEKEFHPSTWNGGSSRIRESAQSFNYSEVLHHMFWTQRQVNPDRTKTAGEEAKKGFRELQL